MLSNTEAEFSSCSSPKSYSGLSNDAYTFQVRAVNEAGNKGSPASFTWTVWPLGTPLPPEVPPRGKATSIFGEGGVADRAVNVAFTALLIAASLFIMVAAFQFLTGGGNPEAISGARDKLIWAAAGIGVALFAKGAATILENVLVGPSVPGPDPCAGLKPSTGAIPNPLKTICFSGILDSILNVIFTLSLIVVPFMVIYAGFLFVSGGGNPEQITRARNTLIWTAVGFGVILIAKGLPFILKDILGI
jgi:hypothetical protein